MAVKKCSGKDCKKMIDAASAVPYCESCEVVAFNEASEESQHGMYLKVREFIMSNSRTTKYIVSKETGVPVKVIEKWIKEGKIEELTGELVRENKCLACGKKIQEGTLCAHCKSSLTPNEVKAAQEVGFRSSAFSKNK